MTETASEKLTRRERYALSNSGWFQMATGWKFLFGGSVLEAGKFSERGWLDAYGLTEAGIAKRDEAGCVTEKTPPIARLSAEQLAEKSA